MPRLLEVLATGSRAVLVAPPGAGKTTRVPLALLDAPWRAGGRIVVLEPRRLAARAAARFMAKSLGEDVGGTVGYRVRLESRVGSTTRIEVVTEGVFTRILLDDPELDGVAAVVFDEFHERSLEADLGLALALDASALRPDLRLLVMSATIDGARVSSLLGDAPVVESEGRAFPVETRYAPPDPLQRLEDQVAATTLAALRADEGSILVFLPGQAEIARVAERLASRTPSDTDIAPLYGQLNAEEQDRAIAPAPPGRRKVVLATSIAETSLTIEGIRIVVDSGFRRVPVYDPATGLSALETRRVSRAAADQRRGRAGRTASGICYRLWSEGQTGALEPFDAPEILSADLTGLALDLASWGVSDPRSLRFPDPPPGPAWAEAVALLKQLDAVDAAGRITAEGRALARLPLHPRLAHMVHASEDKGTAAELAVLLTERGLGGDDTDLAHRLVRFRADRSRRAEDARALARRWGGPAGRVTDVGRILARAFPDRIAQQSGGRGRYRLANGRAALLEETDPLSREPFLAVSEVTGSAATGRIRAAAALTRDDIEMLLASHIATETVLYWDEAAAAVRARRRRTCGALVLADDPVPVPPGEAAARLLAEHVVDRLPWSREQRALVERAQFLGRPIVVAPGDLLTGLHGKTALAELAPADLDPLIPHALRAEIERQLPSHFTAPTGTRVPIDYAADSGPTIEIRVQELFGLDRHPTLAGGRLPLTLVLLSPAHRPIQTTRDLPGFWRGSWKDVAKDMRGRYPRHLWPDDPSAAAPTTRAKPRGT
ncbi:MAG TPA: ATP-dependent helicase HrpB, partial [Devosia sp.]|nr:ATP-dependent helicase HrpB [Devosia sp.]